MKLRLLNKMRATKTHRDGFEAEIVLEEGESSRVVNLLLETPMDYDPNSSDACWELSPGDSDQARQFQTWLYRGFVVQVEEPGCATSDEIALRVKHSVVKHEKKQARLRREIEAFENASALPKARREKIPESVQLFVWQRDQGRCVRCGSQERLEYDHIIPVSRGGSSTERNIQLFCETCNRQKSDSIGGADPTPLFSAYSDCSAKPPATTAENAEAPAASKPQEVPAASQKGILPTRGKMGIEEIKAWNAEQAKTPEEQAALRAEREKEREERYARRKERIGRIPPEHKAKTKAAMIAARDRVAKTDPELANAITGLIESLTDAASPFWDIRNVMAAIKRHQNRIEARGGRPTAPPWPP